MLKSIVLSGKKLTPEECRQNIVDVFELSTPEQREYRDWETLNSST